MKIFDFNKAKSVVKDRDALLKTAAQEGKTIAETIASDYAAAFEMSEEDGLKLVEDMNACAAEYRMETRKADALLPEEYLQEKIDSIKADDSYTLYQKYCALAGIAKTLDCAGSAGCGEADREALEQALKDAQEGLVLKPEEAVTQADLDELAEHIISSGSICLLAVPEELKKLVTDAIDGEAGTDTPEFNKEDLALLDAYCIYKAIKSGRLIPEPEWKDADSLVLLRAIVFRATAQQDMESIIKEVANGRITWEKAEQLIEKISAVVLLALTTIALILAAAGSAAAFISLASYISTTAAVLLFITLLVTLFALYKGFDYLDDWMVNSASPIIARASIKAAKKAQAFAKNCREKWNEWTDRQKKEAAPAADESPAKETAADEAETEGIKEDPETDTADNAQPDLL